MSNRRTEALVNAIRQQLESETEHGLFLALWGEADSDGGYLLRSDGTMLPVGDYQHGFTHLDQLLTSSDEEQAASARHEAGRIASDMEEITSDDLDELMERFPLAFGADSALVEQALARGDVSVCQLMDLMGQLTTPLVMEGKTACVHRICASQAVTASRLGATENGLTWQTIMVAQPGQNLEGFVDARGMAAINLEGGNAHAFLPAGSFTFEVIPRHCVKPHSP